MSRRPEFESNDNWHNRGYIPHYDASFKYQMITYRLADSLPKKFLNELGARASCPQTKIEIRKKTEALLDNGHGSCVLKDPRCAQIVIDAWYYFDNIRYDLIAYVVMPNHVHVLIRTYKDFSLSSIIHSWKSFTSNKIQEYLKLHAGKMPALPAIWQEEYWDRFIRDEKHFTSAIKYILENPINAGLVQQPQDWPWQYYKQA